MSCRYDLLHALFRLRSVFCDVLQEGFAAGTAADAGISEPGHAVKRVVRLEVWVVANGVEPVIG